MSESIIQKKTGKLIQKELSEILNRDLKYVSSVMLTVSVVRMSPDLREAKVYLSTLPDNKLNETVNVHNENDWEVRHALAKRIRNKLRQMPNLTFYADDSLGEAENITNILDGLDIPPPTPEEED